MPLIKNESRVEDPWTVVEAIEDLPPEGPVIVPLELWREHRESMLKRGGGLGVRLTPGQPPEEIAGDLPRLQLVALEFPKFTDGRPYSYARLLRERYRFEGELRAVGHVLRDQALFMVRCGFDAFEVADEATVEAWREALRRISVVYQRAGDNRLPVPWLRRRRQAAE